MPTDHLERLNTALAGRYALERELGRGGMATVYLADDVKHHRKVALKVLHPGLSSLIGPERFLREIEIAAKLNHPHILALYDSGRAGEFLFYVMPYVKGQSLRHRLLRERQFPIDEAISVTHDAALALDHAHAYGVIHRDVKPENILLYEGEAVVADFGIALAVSGSPDQRLTERGVWVGTPEYMSPEQALGEDPLDARSDVYSLGCVLYELLAGEPPYTGPTAQAVIAKRLAGPTPRVRHLRATVPAGVEQALLRALATVPTDRFRSAAAFAEALTQPAAVRPIGSPEAPPEGSRITEDVIDQLTKKIASALKTELAKEPTRDLQAHKLYLQGRRCAFRYTPEGVRKGIEYFQQAIVKDPRYALAYVGLALAYAEIGLGHATGVLKPREAYHLAGKAVAKALELDAELGEAHAILAFLKIVRDFDWNGAELEFKRALTLNPGSADTHDLYGHMLSALERHDEAVAAQTRAQQLDPVAHRSDLAATLLCAGRYDEALRAAALVIDLDPHHAMGYATLGWACLKKGTYAKGLAELEQAVTLSPGNTLFLAQLGQAQALVGQEDRAREILAHLQQLASRRYVSPDHMAYVYTGLGDADQAMDSLERAYEERAGGVYEIKGSFLITPLRSHPRFKALLSRMNLGSTFTRSDRGERRGTRQY